VKTISEGSTAPDFELPDENGRPVRLSEALADGPVVLFFYPVAKQKQFTDTNAFDYPLLSDESREVATAYGVRRRFITPVKRATFVIGEDMVVHKVITSEMNMQVHADQALAALR
jgi:peroxiredoxin Q/BCP